MKKTVYRDDFIEAFEKMRPDNFTRAGLHALYDYFEGYEESTGEEIELDVIAICIEYTEYADFKEIQENYTNLNSMEELEDNTEVIEFDGGIIIRDY